MRHRHTIIGAAAVSLCAALQFSASAQETRQFVVPADAEAVLYIDTEALRRSSYGALIPRTERNQLIDKLYEYATRPSEQQNQVDDTTPSPPGFDQIRNLIGLDAIQRASTITIVVSDMENVKQSFTVKARFTTEAPNLEEVLSKLPGYEAIAYREYQIYSALIENEMRFFGATHSDTDGTKRMLISHDRDIIKALLDDLDGQHRPGGPDLRTLTMDTSDRAFLSVQITELGVYAVIV